MNNGTLLSYIEALERQRNRPAFFYKTGFRTFSTSYLQLFKGIQRRAAYFEKRGFTKGSRIILWGTNSPEWVANFLACLFKGIIAIPLDVHSSIDFVKKIFNFTAADLILGNFHSGAEFSGEQFLSFEALKEKVRQLSPEGVRSETINPTDTAEILFTSGTTAEPKGVVLTHENIFSNVEAFQGFYQDLGSDEKWLSLLPLSHIFEQTVGLLFCLRRGYSTTYLKVLKPSAIFKALEEDGITSVPIVPRLLSLLQGGIQREIKRQHKEKFFNLLLGVSGKISPAKRRALFPALKKRFGKLRFFISGGAALESELENFWERIGVPIVQGYGLTETSPVISCNTPKVRRIGSIGKILPSVEVRLSPEKEICVKGRSVFSEYYRNPEKTNEVFEGEWFKTGDLGRFDEDGFLYYLGRREDLIVTSGGLNVYPADVEAVLHKVKGIKEAVVLGVKQSAGQTIHAVLLLDDPSLNFKKLVEQANAKLEDYQRIQSSSVWSKDDFPRTLTMKIKKNEVRRVVLEESAPTSKKMETKEKAPKLYVIVAQLAKVNISEIKKKDKLGDDLGLSSLDRVELATIIEEEFHFDVPDGFFMAETRMEEIEKLIYTSASAKDKAFARWAIKKWACQMRVWLQNGFVFPLVRHFCKLRIEGRENLRDLKGPVLFIANHTSHLDAPTVLFSLTKEVRAKTAVAAWAEFFEVGSFHPIKWICRRFNFYFTSIAFNIFPFSQIKQTKKSMEHAGWLIDQGFNVLFFPEGARTLTGKMNSFKDGIGMMVTEMGVPVVPVAVKGLFELLPRRSFLPKKGSGGCRIGKPIVFENSTYEEIKETLEDELRRLIDKISLKN